MGSRPAILAERYAADKPVRLVGVNGFHQYWSGAVWKEVHEFLDTYLGDTNMPRIAAYEAQNDFVVLLESDAKGEVRGRFTLPSFAAAGDGQRWRLGSDLTPDKASKSDMLSSFTYSPSPPGAWTAPVQDQATFTSATLTDITIMAGSGSADLWIAAEAEDVDLQVALSEVRPDGEEMLVQSGWLRASHRALDEDASTPIRPRHLHSAESLSKLVPGELTPVRIDLFPFAHVFRKGSQIRITISGPGAGVNAWPWSFDARSGGFPVKVAYDSDDHPSSIVLPVVRPTDMSLPASLPESDSVWLQPSRPAR